MYLYIINIPVFKIVFLYTSYIFQLILHFYPSDAILPVIFMYVKERISF